VEAIPCLKLHFPFNLRLSTTQTSNDISFKDLKCREFLPLNLCIQVMNTCETMHFGLVKLERQVQHVKPCHKKKYEICNVPIERDKIDQRYRE
jgi:hypothetical protein